MVDFFSVKIRILGKKWATIAGFFESFVPKFELFFVQFASECPNGDPKRPTGRTPQITLLPGRSRAPQSAKREYPHARWATRPRTQENGK